MKYFALLFLISAFFLNFYTIPVNAGSEFDRYLSDFYQKQDQAGKILKEIETDLKDGSSDRVCARQRVAASFGIEATEALIKALKIHGSKSQIEEIKAGRDKWIKLRDSC